DPGPAPDADNNGAPNCDRSRIRLHPVHLPFAVARPIVWALNAKRGLLVEPDVFEAPAVEDAVDHHPQALDPRLPAGGEPAGDRRSASPDPPAISCRFP